MKHTKAPLHKRHRQAYRQIYRVIDGAVADAILQHPEFFALGRQRNARTSIAKRVAGAVCGYLVEKELRRPKGRGGAGPERIVRRLSTEGSALHADFRAVRAG